MPNKSKQCPKCKEFDRDVCQTMVVELDEDGLPYWYCGWCGNTEELEEQEWDEKAPLQFFNFLKDVYGDKEEEGDRENRVAIDDLESLEYEEKNPETIRISTGMKNTLDEIIAKVNKIAPEIELDYSDFLDFITDSFFEGWSISFEDLMNYYGYEKTEKGWKKEE